MSMKENNQTGPASFGMTAEEAAESLSKVLFSNSKNTEELLPTAWTTAPEDIDKATWEDFEIRSMYPYMSTLKGPKPRKGGFCGHCSTITDKERRKLNSCPECGKSYFAYRGGKRK